MPAPSDLSSPIRRISTRDMETADQVLRKVYGPEIKAEFSAGDDAFGLDYTVATIGDLILVRVDAEGLNCGRTLDGLIQLFVPLRGELLHQPRGKDQIIADRGRGFVTKHEVPSQQSGARGSALVLTAHVNDIADRAELLIGSRPSVNLHDAMPDDLNLESGLGAVLVRNMKLAYSEILDLETLGYSNLAMRSYEEILVNIATTLLMPEVAGKLARSERQSAPLTIRRARDYIVEHATDVIEISRLAADLGISMRTLQVNFQRVYGFSPRDFIIECRLELARKQLMSGCPATGVTEIALACGFPNLGHFAAKYRDKYGELPSETMRKSRA